MQVTCNKGDFSQSGECETILWVTEKLREKVVPTHTKEEKLFLKPFYHIIIISPSQVLNVEGLEGH